MKDLIGFLEYRSDEFISEVVKKLREKGYEANYIKLRHWRVPLHSKYKIIVDRLSYSIPILRELLKNFALDGTYVINNPFFASVTNKIIDSKICTQNDIPIPTTHILPKLAEGDPLEMISRPHWEKIEGDIGFPCVLKPYDGYAKEKVFIVNTLDELKNLYSILKTDHILLVQKYIYPSSVYRVFCVGKEKTIIIKWNPPQVTDLSEIRSSIKNIELMTKLISRKINFDFNSVEWAVDEKGKLFLIDAFNDVPLISLKEMPKQYYDLILNNFIELIEQKFNSSSVNIEPEVEEITKHIIKY
jgi:hypothetical protein